MTAPRTLRQRLARAALDHRIVRSAETEMVLVQLVRYAVEHGVTYRQVSEVCEWASPSTAHKYGGRLRFRPGIALDEPVPEELP